MYSRRRESQGAFTLIELTVVVTIIALLAVVLVVGFSGVGQRARTRSTQALILTLAQGCERFKDACGYYPPDAPGSSGGVGGWVEGDPPPWSDDERCIFVSETRVDSSDLYIGLLEYLGLADPSDDVEPAEALAFCVLLEQKGGTRIK